MKKNDFYDELQEALEFEEVKLTEKTEFRKIDGYDSLHVMMIIAFVDSRFGKRLTAKQLFNITDVRSLMELIGLDNFEE
jgi:acyl carrier protein